MAAVRSSISLAGTVISRRIYALWGERASASGIGYFPARAVAWSLLLRWSLLAAALSAELLALTLTFNSPVVFASDPWWLQLTAHVPTLLRVAVAFSGAFFVLLAPRLGATLQDAREASADYRWWSWLLLHLAALLALWLIVSATFGQVFPTGRFFAGKVVLCAGVGLLAVFFWLLALAPPLYWRDFVLRERLILAVAASSGVAAWLAVKLVELCWEPLALAALFLAGHLLQLFYPDVTSDPAQLVFGTPSFGIRILPQCSGYEGIGLVTVFLALYLWLFRNQVRFPRAFLLFPIGAVAIWLANVLRLAGLVAIGTSYSPRLALGGFHSQAGWMSFTGLALGFIFVTHRTRFFARLGPDTAAQKINPVAAALLVPFLVMMASAIVAALFSQGFDWLYALKMLVTGGALGWFYRIYRRWDWSWSWPSIGIGVVVFIVWILLEPLTPAVNSTLGANIAALHPTAAVGWVSSRVIGSVLIIPLVEEMAFRGYLLRRLAAADFECFEASRFNWIPFLLSSVAFGLLHGRWLAGSLAGGAYALGFYRRGKLGDPVIAHMTTNGMIAVYVLTTGTWSLWS